MRRISPAELLFLIRYALSRLPKSLLREMLAADRNKRDVAVRLAADQVAEQFKHHEVSARSKSAGH